MSALDEVAAAVRALAHETDKQRVADVIAAQFGLTQKRSLYVGPALAVRFSQVNKPDGPFSNVVLSLRALLKVDDRPVLVCVVQPGRTRLLLANTTMLRKISHSSKSLRVDNVRGSFLGSDIAPSVAGLDNTPANFEALFAHHLLLDPDEQLERLVVATQGITPTKQRLRLTPAMEGLLMQAPARAAALADERELQQLTDAAQRQATTFADALGRAAEHDNVNLRGQLIEVLVLGTEAEARAAALALASGRTPTLPPLGHGLGDAARQVGGHLLLIDLKSKRLDMPSNPKGYNVDKALAHLATADGALGLLLVGLRPGAPPIVRFASIFEPRLLATARVVDHWAGRGGRGVTLLSGEALRAVIEEGPRPIYVAAAQATIRAWIAG